MASNITQSSSLSAAAAATSADAARAAEVAEFVDSALFTWIESCLPAHEPALVGYAALHDAHVLHRIWLQIDPEPQHHPQPLDAAASACHISAGGAQDALAHVANVRARNFDALIRNLKALFEEELDQTVLVLPDCAVLGHAPESRAGLEQMKLLLTLLLGAAVQCPNKEIFIGRIKELPVDTQLAIVELIKQVTDNQTLVLTNDSLELLSPERMYEHIIRIARERDRFQSNWIASLAGGGLGGEAAQAVGAGAGDAKLGTAGGVGQATAAAAVAAIAASSGAGGAYGAAGLAGVATATDSGHMAVELADAKSKLRRFRQELEEKSESYVEVKEELEHTQLQFEKLRAESQKWYAESRKAAAYRDEVDVLQERAERANRLEAEVQRLREKLSDAEFFKTRVEELREDNRMLLETKEMLEDQLARSRKRSDQAMQLETDIMKYKQRLNDMALDRDADKARLHEVLEENTQLQLAAKQAAGGTAGARTDADTGSGADGATSDEDDCASGDNSLSEQLTNNAQTRALKLELENRRLQAALEALREASFHEHAAKLLDAEKDKKRLQLKCDQLQENCTRLGTQNSELEAVFKNALDENRKLQDAIDQRRAAGERQQLDRDVDRMKLIDTEKHVEQLTKEKQRVQTLSESIQRRADDLERTLLAANVQLEQQLPRAERCVAAEQQLEDIRARVAATDKENATLARDLSKLREACEAKDVRLDEQATAAAQQTKEMQQLRQSVRDVEAGAQRLAELEVRANELQRQSAIDQQTIETLRSDLVEQTLAADRVRTDLAEKLGLADGGLLDAGVELNVESVVQTLVKNPETFKTVKEIMLSVARAENAALSAQMTSSEMAVLCHRHDVFTVERSIDIGNDDGNVSRQRQAELEVAVSSGPAPSSASSADASTATAPVGGEPPSKRVEFNVSLEPPALGLLRDQLAALHADHAALRSAHEALQSENARHRVDATTLGSQIASLHTQHVALQLANTQLAAEKDTLVRQVDAVRSERQQLVHDQRTLQCLHEQLTAEYEALSGDREQLKQALRAERTETRQLRDRDAAAAAQVEEVRAQLAGVRKENEHLGNLRAEHSKLKDDFRNLFTTSERLKAEYKNIQAQYKVLRAENGALRLQTGKLADELSTRAEQAQQVELEYGRCAQRCELLLQMNASLDTDRRALMEHVSQLLAQYQDLLVHSLDDKQHYHDEEKLFTDKVNNLHRQKEKLEEKIMEHYRKLESCSPKKKPFGASFVKRVKKASTDLINKVPSRNRRSWMLEDPRLTQSEHQLGGGIGGGGGSESGGNESDNSCDDLQMSATSAASSSSAVPSSAVYAALSSGGGTLHDTNNSSGSSSGAGFGAGSPNVSGIVAPTAVHGGSGASLPASALPPMLQRNAHHRQSLQRRPGHHGDGAQSSQSPATLMRTGVRSSYQSLRREDSVRSHRNSIHSMEPPDVTGSSLTLGTAGSRRTVYLLDENAGKLAADNKTASSGQSTSTRNANSSPDHGAAAATGSRHSPLPAVVGPASTHSSNNNSDTTSASAASQAAAAGAPPATFLMFNRISNVIGGPVEGQPTDGGGYNGERGREKPAKPTAPTTAAPASGGEDGKESAIWYEYGCI